ncbi:MAG TPA: hypothetical protein VE954_12655 [Oligoflexus sp.]|uniref:hypothetical protein n=1 Tax=Oligoflexus sp. TaxID=1971216 RepID=UPI002D393B62|nr:hypothetical protein [Oligoflexus sp.]HYX33958.1 hypothetical protein [Oligoflexus sp.]
MSNAAKKQRNREYYQKNRDRILNKAKVRKSQKHTPRLEVVPALEHELIQASGAERTSVSADVAESVQAISDSQALSAPSEIAEQGMIFSTPESANDQKTGDTEAIKMGRRLKLAGSVAEKNEFSCKSELKADNLMSLGSVSFFKRMPLSFIFRLLLVAGLTVLMTAMQVAFYREHDILPGFAVPLALASELAFLSLVTMKFSRGAEWLRIMVHLTFFGYFVSALSFHVYAKSRVKAASQPSVTISETTQISEQLKQAERSLDVATKGRAWKNMEIFGAEVSRLRKLKNDLPSNQVLGTSSGQTMWIEAILLILLRALLLAASSLNALRLRDQFLEMARCLRCLRTV